MKSLICALVVVTLVAFSSVHAAERGKVKKTRSVDGFRKEQHQRRQEHAKTQKQENREFHKTLKGLDKDEKVASVKEHRTTQFNENKEFNETQYANRVEHATKVMETNGVSTDKQSEILENLAEKHEAVIEHKQTQHNENMQFIDNLAAQDLSKEEARKAVQEHHQTQKAENKEFRDSLHPDPEKKTAATGE